MTVTDINGNAHRPAGSPASTGGQFAAKPAPGQAAPLAPVSVDEQGMRERRTENAYTRDQVRAATSAEHPHAAFIIVEDAGHGLQTTQAVMPNGNVKPIRQALAVDGLDLASMPRGIVSDGVGRYVVKVRPDREARVGELSQMIQGETDPQTRARLGMEGFALVAQKHAPTATAVIIANDVDTGHPAISGLLDEHGAAVFPTDDQLAAFELDAGDFDEAISGDPRAAFDLADNHSIIQLADYR